MRTASARPFRFWKVSSSASLARNRRAFFHHDNEHIAIDFNTHILEETGGILRLDCSHTLFIGEGFTNTHWKITKHSTGLSTLYSFYADIFNLKRFNR